MTDDDFAAQAMVEMQKELERARQPKPWQHCDIHPDVNPEHHWACADCMAQARHDVHLLEDMLQWALRLIGNSPDDDHLVQEYRFVDEGNALVTRIQQDYPHGRV